MQKKMFINYIKKNNVTADMDMKNDEPKRHYLQIKLLMQIEMVLQNSN